MTWRLGAAVTVVVVLAAGVAWLRTSGVMRPEGAAERFLQAVSIGDEAQAARWGDLAASGTLIATDDGGDPRFSTIEIGRATTEAGIARVPARLVRNDGAHTEVHLAVTARRSSKSSASRWRVVAVDTVARAEVPSRGGPRPARADPRLFLGVIPAVLAVGVVADLVVARMRRAGRSAPLVANWVPPDS